MDCQALMLSGNFGTASTGLKTAHAELGTLPYAKPYSSYGMRSVAGSTWQMSCSVFKSNSEPLQLARVSGKGSTVQKSDLRFIGATLRLKELTIRSVIDQCCHRGQLDPLNEKPVCE